MVINEETNIKPVWRVKSSADDMQVEGDHYKKMIIEPWDVMEVALTEEEFRGYLKGNFIKYAMRDGKKPGAIRDADKAIHYRAKLLEMQQK